MMNQQTILITGNTYPVKDSLRALGGRWDPQAKGWRVPMAVAVQAQDLVAGAPKSTPRQVSAQSSRRYIPSSRGGGSRLGGRRTGCSCGSIEDRPRDSDCAQCRYDSE